MRCSSGPRVRRKETWNQSSADENVHLFTLLSKQNHLSLNKLFGHLFGVSSHSLSRLFDIHF